MKWTHPELDRVFNTESETIPTLVIESQPFFVRILSDIRQQIDGNSGQGIISKNETPVAFAKNADVVDSFVPFDVNRKSLLVKVASALEKTASSPEQTTQTGNILQQLQAYLEGLAFEYPCDIIFPKLSIGGIIRSVGVELRNEYSSIAEAVIDYMELVLTFDHERLFFIVNMRCFVSDGEMALFMSTALSHGYHLIMLESHAYPLLPLEKRTIVDEDLCEI